MKYILAVDDEPMNLEIIQAILLDKYEFNFLENGVECLKSIKERLPDLLLLDYAMPEMNGLEVVAQLRSNELTKLLPVVMISGFASQEHMDNGFKAGINEYITKPYKPDQLINIVQQYLG